MAMTFDPKKPVQTRDGRAARIICDDKISTGEKTIIALMLDGADEVVGYYYDNGQVYSDCEKQNDLINIPEKRWAVLLNNGSWVEQDHPMQAGQIIPYNGKVFKPPLPIACIEFTEGDGI